MEIQTHQVNKSQAGVPSFPVHSGDSVNSHNSSSEMRK
jgi:signal transduction histidine kinase